MIVAAGNLLAKVIFSGVMVNTLGDTPIVQVN